MPDADLFLAEQQAVTFGQPGAWFQLAIGLRDGSAESLDEEQRSRKQAGA